MSKGHCNFLFSLSKEKILYTVLSYQLMLLNIAVYFFTAFLYPCVDTLYIANLEYSKGLCEGIRELKLVVNTRVLFNLQVTVLFT